ncbi:MAG TPA: hypothetical protein PKH33_02980 [bacterium]|nr:hypothetical protein [bacterium]
MKTRIPAAFIAVFCLFAATVAAQEAAKNDDRDRFNPLIERIEGQVYSNYVYGFEIAAREDWHISTNQFVRKQSKENNIASYFNDLAESEKEFNPMEYEGTIVEILKEPYGSIIEYNPSLEVTMLDVSKQPQKPTFENLDIYVGLNLKNNAANYYQQESGEFDINGVKMKRIIFSKEMRYGGEKNFKGIIYAFMFDEDHVLLMQGTSLEHTYKKYEEAFIKTAESFRFTDSLAVMREAFNSYGKASKFYKGVKEWSDPDKTKTIENLEKAISLYPELREAHQLKIRVYRDLKKKEEIVDPAIKYFSSGEIESRAYGLMTMILFDFKDAAEKVINHLLKEQPENKDFKTFKLMALKDGQKAENLEPARKLAEELRDRADMCPEARKHIKIAEQWLEEMDKKREEAQKSASAQATMAEGIADEKMKGMFRNALLTSKCVEALEELGDFLKFSGLFRATGMANYRGQAVSAGENLGNRIIVLKAIAAGTSPEKKVDEIEKKQQEMMLAFDAAVASEKGDGWPALTEKSSSLEKALRLLMNGSRLSDETVRKAFEKAD